MSPGLATDEMIIRFPGDQRVEARYGDLRIPTDQPSPDGHPDAPAPFDLFLASLGTCAGFYVLRFCRTRDIPTADLTIRQRWERDPVTHRVTAITLELALPAGFPAKYEAAVLRAAEQCAVHRLLHDPPRIDLAVRR